ncbi:unnamed protein product [Effrenium voratum]|uniref:ABC transporter domain-containing protein n=1 Tax=Effrenium voratum TaxID=2562239 RepID=A0AA36IM90_9DINO|nr:unnamed protein product [Effrenium voratum]CAJ1449268.1 unnamed protein product [Effrenium voratum]
MTGKTGGQGGKGVAVSFNKLTYTVPVKKKEKLDIIKDLNGVFHPGRLTALMGPSGSGKTTLMDILAGRKSGAGKIQGEVLYGGCSAPPAVLKHLTGYVEQFDTLIGELTVDQMLMYTAEMKLPRSVPYAEKRKRVDNVIQQLRLNKCQNTVIGSVLSRGISGGQAKRVNVALALISQPLVVYLDEPTSGLDSKMANEVCAILKELVKDGYTIIATVHSPTSFAFSLFDDLMMLQAGGAMVYAGPVADVKNYFVTCGFPFPEEQGYSLPDWLVDTTSGATGATTDATEIEDGAPATADFAAHWAKSKHSEAYSKEFEETLAKLKADPAPLKELPTSGPGQLKALRTLLSYRTSTHYRDGEFLGPRFGDKIFMSLLSLSLYWGIGSKKDAQSIQSTAAVLFFFCALCGYGAAAYVPSLTLERALFYRERADGLYTAVTYYVAKFIEEAVLCIFTSLVFSLAVFWAMELQGSFIIFAVSYFLTSMVGIVLAYAVAAVAPNMDAANAMLPTYVTTCLYFGGLFIVFEKIPVGWYWYSWTSFMRYSWGMLMLNQFQDQATGQEAVFYNDGGVVTVLEFYNLNEGLMSDMGFCAGVLSGLLILFGFLGALGLTFVSHVKR